MHSGGLFRLRWQKLVEKLVQRSHSPCQGVFGELKETVPSIHSTVGCMVSLTVFIAVELDLHWCIAIGFAMAAREDGRTPQGASELIGIVGKMIYRHEIRQKRACLDLDYGCCGNGLRRLWLHLD